MILKEDVGPHPKGTAVTRQSSHEPEPDGSALCVDSKRFEAWQAAGLLEEESEPAVKKKPRKKKGVSP